MSPRPLLAVLLLLAGAAPSAADVELLPETSLHLEAANYQPPREDVRWSGWIGAGAGLLRVGKVTGWFNADLETILGNTRRSFDATQANYHLELSLRRPIRGMTAEIVFHHVSRHLQDRSKVPAVDWNVLGGRVSGIAKGVRLMASLGHTTQASTVGYEWEAIAKADRDLVPLGSAHAYAAASLRYVTAEPAPPHLTRTSLLDIRLEAGPRWNRGDRSLQLFAAFERRNDVLLQEDSREDRALFGFRIHAAPK